VPGQDVAWARPFKSLFPPGSWELYPVAQVLAHDKAAMLHHDLGKFVTDRPSLAWTLALGFAMSDRVTARALGSPRTIEWLRWLDRVQKSICSRYVGEPVRSFQHEPGLNQNDDGLVRAEYGPVQLVANLGPEARPAGGRTLPGWGFLAIAPGLIAGNVQGIGGVDLGPNGAAFVVEGDSGTADVWVLARPGQTAGCLVPLGMTGHVRLTLDGQLPRDVTAQDGAVTFTVPAPAGTTGDAPYVCHGVVKGQH
jgi:hypothetical protein